MVVVLHLLIPHTSSSSRDLSAVALNKIYTNIYHSLYILEGSPAILPGSRFGMKASASLEVV